MWAGAAHTPRVSGNRRRPYGSLDQSHPTCRCARRDHRIPATPTCPPERLGVAWRRSSRGEGVVDASECEAPEDQGEVGPRPQVSEWRWLEGPRPREGARGGPGAADGDRRDPPGNLEVAN